MEKPKSKYAKSKKHKSKIKEKKREKKERQKEKKMGKNGLVHLHFFFCLLIVFLPLFCFFPGKKPKKQIEKAKKNANGQVHFSHFFTLFDVPFFPIYFVSCFFRFWSFAFSFSMRFLFFCIFSSLKNIRTSRRGENNRCPEACSVPQCHAVWLWPGRSFRALAAGRFEA